MKKVIFVLSRYNNEEITGQDRICFLSGMMKLDYVMDSLKENGYNIELISASNARNNTIYLPKNVVLDEKTKLHLILGFSIKSKMGIVCSNIVFQWILFFYLLFKIPSKSTVLVYHSCSYMKTVHILKKLKKINLLLEVEEIFGDVSNNEKLSKRELSYFKNADAYIFPTIMLNDKVNTTCKPFSIAHGTYRVTPQFIQRIDDGKIHVVYAGTFNTTKGGASAATAAAAYLPPNYHMHICGFGTKEQIDNIIKQIEEVNKLNKSIVTYEGLLKGQEYLGMLQKCDIGLSTQDPTAKFNATSFPSKILSYMANGLRVVSVNIPAIRTSEIGNFLYYYKEQTGEDISRAIMSIDLSSPYDSRKVLDNLNTIFVEDIGKLLRCANA